MDRDDGRGKLPEITSLNDADLSVDELEQRLELMAALIKNCGTYTCHGLHDGCSQLESCNVYTWG